MGSAKSIRIKAKGMKTEICDLSAASDPRDLITMIDYLIVEVRPLSSLTAFCLSMARDELCRIAETRTIAEPTQRTRH